MHPKVWSLFFSYRWTSVRGRRMWGACAVGAGWGFAHRTQFARGNPFSRTGSRKYPHGSKTVCAPVLGSVGLLSRRTWSELPLHTSSQHYCWDVCRNFDVRIQTVFPTLMLTAWGGGAVLFQPSRGMPAKLRKVVGKLGKGGARPQSLWRTSTIKNTIS